MTHAVILKRWRSWNCKRDDTMKSYKKNTYSIVISILADQWGRVELLINNHICYNIAIFIQHNSKLTVVAKINCSLTVKV